MARRKENYRKHKKNKGRFKKKPKKSGSQTSEPKLPVKMDPSSSIQEVKPYFNYKHSKYIYLGLLELYFGTSIFKEKRASLHMMKDSEINPAMLAEKCTSIETYEYTAQKNGKFIVTVKNLEANTTQQVLSFNGIYEILMKLHLQDNHNCSALKSSTKEYKIPDVCYDLIPIACNVCKATSSKNTGASNTGIVTFIHHMDLRSTEYHNSVLIYLDESTEFIILRPIKSYAIGEVVTELFKIFMEIGPPETVYMNLSGRLTDVFEHIMKSLCPSCKFVFGYYDKRQILPMLVLDAFGTWMKETDSSHWEVGCPIVQRRLNTQVKINLPISRIPVTTHDLFFKNPPVFEKIHEAAWRWHSKTTVVTNPIQMKPHQIKSVETTESTLKMSFDEPLVYVEQNAVLDVVDPLATHVTNLNIEDKSVKGKTSGIKTSSQPIIETEMYSSDAKEIPVSSKKKTKGNKRIIQKQTSSKSKENDLLDNMTHDNVKANKDVVARGIEDSQKAIEIKVPANNKELTISPNNEKRQENINEETFKTVAITIELTEEIETGNVTHSEEVKTMNAEASANSTNKGGNDNTVADDDDEDCMIDFGAEI